jgi:hypothetical protein
MPTPKLKLKLNLDCCWHCDCPYIQSRSDQRYCSASCRGHDWRQRQLVRYRRPRSRRCP